MSEEFVEDNNRIDIETSDEGSSLMESIPTSHEDNKKVSQLDFSGQLLKVQQHEKVVFQTQADSPNCPECGSIMVRNGNCYKCLECGTTSGCS